MCTIQNVNDKLIVFGDTMDQSGIQAIQHIPNPGKFLVESGLLFKINREILHPLGVALAVTLNDSDETVSINVLDGRHSPEGILFTDEMLTGGIEKLQKYMDKHGYQAIDSRQQYLGFKIQAKTKH